MFTKRLRQASLLMCFGSFVFAIPSANAQDGASFIEEIVVTATKRQKTLQEVPVAVSVVGAEQIEKAFIQDVQDLQASVPSLQVTPLQSSRNTNFVIRGFGNGANNVGIEPSVGVFIDGVYRSRTASAIADLPRLERVEVLRGPQSTLFGKNASAGVISVVTAKPNTQEIEGYIQGTYGNYDQILGKAYVTGPLSDKWAYDLYASYNSRDGYTDNLLIGDDDAINNRDRYSLRGQLLYTPTDTSEFRLIVDYEEADEFCCTADHIQRGSVGPLIEQLGGVALNEDPFDYAVNYNQNPISSYENSGISLHSEIEFDGFSLTSITAFRNGQSAENQDADFAAFEFLLVDIESDIDTFTQEIRLTSNNTDGPIDWMVGGFYFDETVDYVQTLYNQADTRAYFDTLAGGGIPMVEALLGVPIGTYFQEGISVQTPSGQDNEAFSIFGTVDWHVSDRLTATLGLNYTKDEKETFTFQSVTEPFSSLDFEAIGAGAAFTSITGLAPTAANFAAVPAAAAAAATIGGTACTAATAAACNQLLAFQPLQVLPPFQAYPNQFEDGRTEDDELTYTIRLAYDASDSTNVYASYATGFKATSWNLSLDSRPFPADFASLQAAGLAVPNLVSGTRYAGPEDARVIELGLKTRFDRGYFNIAIFNQEIEGLQGNTFTGLGFNLSNAGKQSTDGVELDLTYYPTDALQLTLAGTFLDPVYDSYVAGNGVDGPEDLSGQTPAGIHEVAITTSATYSFDLNNSWNGFVRGEYIYQDEVPIVDNVPASLVSREVNTLNLSAGFENENGFKVTLWGRNVTDDEYLISAFPIPAQGSGSTATFAGYPNPPSNLGYLTH